MTVYQHYLTKFVNQIEGFLFFSFTTHISCLPEVFDRLRGAGLKLKPSKCALPQPEVKYLVHVVRRNSVATDPEKVRAVEN